jgi:ribonuclease P protein component
VLNRRHRLLTSDDFRTVLRRGRKTGIAGGLVAVLQTQKEEPLRCGFVVTKAVGNAVERNVVKRRLRAAFAYLVDAHPGVDVVVRADRNALSVTVDAWRGALAAVLDKSATP